MSINKIKTSKKKVRWEVCVRLPHMNEKKIRRRFDRKIDAQNFLEALKEKKKTSKLGLKQKAKDIEGVTFKELAEYWLLKREDTFTEGYLRVIKPVLKNVIPLYGNYKVARLTPELLDDLRLILKKRGLSEATQNRYLEIIYRIVNFSYLQRRIDSNPCFGYRKVNEKTKEMLFWNEEEVFYFLNHVNEKYPLGSDGRWKYCVYLVALETAMRAGEIWGMKTEDLVLNSTKFKVKHQYLRSGEFSLTKGKDSRYVPMSRNLLKELKAECERIKCHSLSGTIFCSKSFSPVDHDNFSKRVFQKDLKSSGIKKIRFHDLRHTAITMMVKRGIALPIIKAIAGHKKIETTMGYVHVIGQDIEEIGASFSLRK